MNAVGQRSYPRKHYTVAELLAREASGIGTPYQREREVIRPRAPLSVTELLRREGVDFAGDSNPTVELPASAPVHVTKLLQRESEQAEPGQKRRPQRIAAIGSAAALCGLTIAGLIALKPTTALSPGGLADDPQQQPAGSSPAQEDTIKPTTTVLKRANSTKATSGATESAAPGTGSQQGNGLSNRSNLVAQQAASSSDAPAPQPTTRQAAPNTTQPSEPTSSSKEQPPKDGDDSEELLDPVTEPVGKILDPVVGTVTGTLDGQLG